MIEKLGQYEILEEIGQGGFATVYRARDTRLGRVVALKELKSLLLQDTSWVQRFHREAKTIAHLDHPRIVPIYDLYETESRLFIVMRLVNGPSLEDVIARQAPLPWAEVVEIISAVAEGLDYAHAQGVTHRDLKPANILLDPERGPMLTDFGLAKLAGENSMSITGSGGFVGTPHYIAPEVWEGEGSQPQSDIYALGCIAYELLTGEKLFKGDTPPAVMMSHFKPPQLPATWPAGVPAGVSDVLKTALSQKPSTRYPTGGKFAAALAALSDWAMPQPQKVVEPTVAPSQPQVDAAAELEPETSLPTAALEESLPTSSSGKWRGFLAHLGPYVMVIGMLGLINLLTDPGGYPWFIWPALGWGVGIAFHLHGILLDEINVSEKWRGFWGHFGSYAIIIGLLISIYAITDFGGYPWFVWPAGIWGAAILMHLWATVIGSDQQHSQRRAARSARWAERRTARAQRRGGSHRSVQVDRRQKLGIVDEKIQAHLDKAKTYKAQIEALIAATSDQATAKRLKELSAQVGEWTSAIEDLARRIVNYQQDEIIRQDLELVPQSIKQLEAQLARETHAATRTELERTLENRRKQLSTLENLQQMMRRAEIKIESTLSALGTIYSQILTSQSTNYVADYGRLSADVDEEVRTLQDHLEALEEVKLGSVE